jgi:hypothetical protein
MVFDLFTIGGFLLFVAVLAALLASHDFRYHPPAGRAAAERARSPKGRNR